MSPCVLDQLGLSIPLIQAPMAGVSTPAMAVAVSNAGGLGSISVGASDVASAQTMFAGVREGTGRAFNVNLFVHATPCVDEVREAAWIDALRPCLDAYDVAVRGA